MEVANTLAFHDRAKITDVESFVVHADLRSVLSQSIFHCQPLPSLPNICGQGQEPILREGSTKVAFKLAFKYQTRVEVTENDKPSQLLVTVKVY